ncbi:hypothetical protein OpiT1DRAFT_03746 [Opitutaceae bacterium TAV1]|nr:hypothetical protein OpiT1DRAFT_03746 [Opitutaceae bacterium TAV1]
MSTSPLLRAVPADPAPDAGPYRRGGWPVVFASLVGTLAAIAGFAFFGRHAPTLAWIPATLAGALSLWGWLCVIRALRDKSVLPRSHSVLAGVLGFNVICTSRGVAATAFVYPDVLPPGGTARLLVFLENYASRQRVVHARISHHPGLDRPVRDYLDFHLAAGQAAVYELPVRATAELTPGFHTLPVRICVSRPNGKGVRLPGSRRHLYDIWRVRFAAPFEYKPDLPPAPATTEPLPAPRFLSLASVSAPRPDLEILRKLVTDSGARQS